MLLVIDVGNTQIALGVFEGDRLLSHWRMETASGRTDDEYGVLLTSLLARDGLDPGRIEHAIMSCVVPPLTGTLASMGRKVLGIEGVMEVGPGLRTGIPILYDNPREVGADRIVNAVAAYARYHQGAIVVDFGTATTFDAISPKGEYLGGLIAPGAGIAAEALFRRAAKLPRVELTRPLVVVGRNTVASMQSGLFYGYMGLVDGIVRRMQAELTFPTRVIATGGLSTVVGQECETVEEVDEMLTLEGLRILFERNVSRK